MEQRRYDIGDEIDFWCSKCRLNLNGNVAAVSEHGEAVQVTCRTCRFTVPFKSEKTKEEMRTTRLRKALALRDKRGPAIDDAEKARKPSGGPEVTKRWRKATEEADARYATRYAPQGSFEVGDFILHRHLGLGIVTEVLHETAVLALFRTEELPLEMNSKEPVELIDE